FVPFRRVPVAVGPQDRFDVDRLLVLHDPRVFELVARSAIAGVGVSLARAAAEIAVVHLRLPSTHGRKAVGTGRSNSMTAFESTGVSTSPGLTTSRSPRRTRLAIVPSGAVTRNSAGWTKTMNILFSSERAWTIGSLVVGPNMPPEGEIRNSAPRMRYSSTIDRSVRSAQIINPARPCGVGKTSDSLPGVFRTCSWPSF